MGEAGLSHFVIRMEGRSRRVLISTTPIDYDGRAESFYDPRHPSVVPANASAALQI